MPKAEIITIGTELLLGDIIDTNTPHIAKSLRNFGIDIFYTSTVGDNPNRIAKSIKDAFTRSDIVISTGGLGPTIDDPTRQAAAIAFDTELIFNEIAWEQVISRFKKFNSTPTENNKQQAYFPIGAIPLENPVGTAPIFYILSENKKIYIALPGVPSEMRYLLEHKIIPLLKKIYTLNSVLISKILHTTGLSESTIDMKISEFEKLNNPTVGITAKVGQVDIRITAKAKNELDANNLIEDVENRIRKKIGDSIYGTDDNDIESLLIQKFNGKNINFAIIESGLSLNYINFFTNKFNNFKEAIYIKEYQEMDRLKKSTNKIIEKNEINFVIAISLLKGNPNILNICLLTKNNEIVKNFEFIRPEEQAIVWAINICNNLLLEIEIN